MNVDELINKLKDLESGYKHLLEKNNKKIELWSRISELSKELIFNLERSEIKTSNIFSVAIDNFSFFDWGELKYFLENLR